MVLDDKLAIDTHILDLENLLDYVIRAWMVDKTASVSNDHKKQGMD